MQKAHNKNSVLTYRAVESLITHILRLCQENSITEMTRRAILTLQHFGKSSFIRVLSCRTFLPITSSLYGTVVTSRTGMIGYWTSQGYIGAPHQRCTIEAGRTGQTDRRFCWVCVRSRFTWLWGGTSNWAMETHWAFVFSSYFTSIRTIVASRAWVCHIMQSICGTIKS